jgi:hypothetical protein
MKHDIYIFDGFTAIYFACSLIHGFTAIYFACSLILHIIIIFMELFSKWSSCFVVEARHLARRQDQFNKINDDCTAPTYFEVVTTIYYWLFLMLKIDKQQAMLKLMFVLVIFVSQDPAEKRGKYRLFLNSTPSTNHYYNILYYNYCQTFPS